MLKRVLVFRSENLLAAGVENLLARENDLLVLGVSNICEGGFSFEHEIELFRPNVVILDEGSLSTDFPFVFEILKRYPHLRVIVVDDWVNRVHVFDKRVIKVSRSNDLVDVIRQEHQAV